MYSLSLFFPCATENSNYANTIDILWHLFLSLSFNKMHLSECWKCNWVSLHATYRLTFVGTFFFHFIPFNCNCGSAFFLTLIFQSFFFVVFIHHSLPLFFVVWDFFFSLNCRFVFLHCITLFIFFQCGLFNEFVYPIWTWFFYIFFFLFVGTLRYDKFINVYGWQVEIFFVDMNFENFIHYVLLLNADYTFLNDFIELIIGWLVFNTRSFFFASMYSKAHKILVNFFILDYFMTFNSALYANVSVFLWLSVTLFSLAVNLSQKIYLFS